MNGTLFDKTDWVDLYGAAAGASGCGPPIYSGEGSGNGYHSYVLFDNTGNHIAVLLLNKDRVNAAHAAQRLYCSG